MAHVQRNDVLFGHIALHLVPALSGGARRVGAAILEHFNKRTGQCDPSIDRLARMLGIGRATVLRATAELCEGEDALFDRVTHGGRSHRTAYLPRWDRLKAIVDDWDLRMKDGDAPKKVSKVRRSNPGSASDDGSGKASSKDSKVRRSRSQNCDLNSLKNETQTDRRNRQNKPTVPVSLSKPDCGKPEPPGKRTCRNGLRNDGAGPKRQRFLVHGIPGGKDTSRQAAAEAAAMRKLTRSIQEIADPEARERAWLAAMGERAAG